MPLYEYQCDACGKRFEVIRKFSDPELDTCTQCGKGPVHRLQSSPAFQFKGTGWYVTDYAQKGKSGGDSSSSSSSKNESKKSESGSSETPAAKSDSTTSTTPPSKPSSSDS